MEGDSRATDSLRALLRGTLDEASPLSMLRGQSLVLDAVAERVWEAEWRDRIGAAIKLDPPEASMLWLLRYLHGDCAPLESLPMPEDCPCRQFFRLVVGPVSVWYSKHNTPNPMGVQPDALISDEDKFETAASAGHDDVQPDDDVHPAAPPSPSPSPPPPPPPSPLPVPSSRSCTVM